MPNPCASRLLSTICSTLLLTGLLSFVPASDHALAQAPSYEVHPDYLVKHFTVEDGLPVRQINDLLQTRDGYLWAATCDGLVRFDGERFTVFNTTNSPGLPGNCVYWLHEDHDGALWLALEMGAMVRYHDGVFTAFDQSNGLPAGEFYQDGDTLWVQTQTGLARYHDGVMQPYRPDSIAGFVGSMLRDRMGAIWVNDGTLKRIGARGTVQHFAPSESVPISKTSYPFEDRDGTLWITTDQGIARLQGERFELLMPTGHPWTPVEVPREIHQQDDGTLWVATSASWWAWRDGRFERFPAVEPGQPGLKLLHGPDGHIWRVQGSWLYRDQTPVLRLIGIEVQVAIRAMTFDHEGNLWLGNDGLYRISPRLLQVLGEAEGLPATTSRQSWSAATAQYGSACGPTRAWCV